MTIAEEDVGIRVAHLLLKIGAVRVRPEEPFTWTSGRRSPVYVDVRRLISFLPERREVIDHACEAIEKRIGAANLDGVAGGETAGIPYAAWLSEALDLPMLYIRKQPKGFGANALIEGATEETGRTLLVEDLASEGGSKLRFIDGMRKAGLQVDHCFVVFHYGIYPQSVSSLEDIGVKLHALATFQDVLAALGDLKQVAKIQALEGFIKDPAGWSAAHEQTGASA